MNERPRILYEESSCSQEANEKANPTIEGRQETTPFNRSSKKSSNISIPTETASLLNALTLS